MKILIAPDKFKHSLSNFEACQAIKEGILTTEIEASVTELPLADGGDGFFDIVKYYTSAKEISLSVSDPLFRKVSSSYLLSQDRGTAFIEMAKASGLILLKPDEYNCTKTSTFGTGELINDAINKGVKKIIIGIGGSATNDGGVGMAAALGFCFLDKYGESLVPSGENLIRIEKIRPPENTDFHKTEFEIACDVSNTLTGETGASLMFSRQKGASMETAQKLEEGMLHYAEVLKNFTGKNIQDVPGSGAAGGLGAGCVAFLNARLKSGIDIVFEYCKAEQFVKEADIVITGEGKLDEQSLQGKVIAGMAKLCQKYHKPLIALCGKLELAEIQIKEAGIVKAVSINKTEKESETIYKNAYALLAKATAGLFTDRAQVQGLISLKK